MTDEKTMALLVEYHHFHGDSRIRHCGFFKPQEESENVMHKIRFVNAQGERYTSLDMICHGKNGEYVTEMMSCERTKEKEMLEEAREVFR